LAGQLGTIAEYSKGKAPDAPEAVMRLTVNTGWILIYPPDTEPSDLLVPGKTDSLWKQNEPCYAAENCGREKILFRNSFILLII
jgi:hypothetical protein